MGIKEVMQKELERISLSENEENEFKNKALDLIKKLNSEGLKAEIGGSLAKGTLIRQDVQDADIFVLFSKEEETANLGKVLSKLKLKAEEIHGSRDYFRIKEMHEGKKIIFEIIPVLKLKSSKKEKSNVTDFSLSHVKYVADKIKKNKKLAGEIKLAKSFCHAQNCYGAESYIRGFSGYALELLVINFGSFEKFLRGIKDKKFFDVEKMWKNESEIRKELNASKLESPVILIDPTYKFRNVTSCLSKEVFDNFLKKAEEFLRAPTLAYFEKKELDLNELKSFAKREDAKLISLSLNTDKQEGDIAGTKMKKFADFVIAELERKEQKVLRKDFEYDSGKSAFAYLVIKSKEWIEIRGPPMKNQKACESFKKARKKVYPKGGYFWTREKINFKQILQNLKRFEEEMSVRMNFSIA